MLDILLSIKYNILLLWRNVMYVFDIETLDVESTSVVLSLAIVYFDDTSTYQSLLDECLFVKFDAREQLKNYKRTISKSTLEWWEKQTDHAKQISFFPSKDDLPAIEGIQKIRSYLRRKSNEKTIIWSRGSIDSVIMDSLCKAVGVKPLVYYNQHREIRTALDIMATTTVNGYCKVSLEGFSKDMVKKHDPVHDVCYDAVQLLYFI